MVETAKKLIEEATELKDLAVKNVNLDALGTMSGDELTFYIKAFRMCDTSSKLMLEQAIMLENINEKLDKLLSRKGS